MQRKKHRSTVTSGTLRRASSWLATVFTNRELLVLLGILALGAYLRLWNVEHLFNAIHDYDEGIYSLAARFISQGHMPYQDFMLVSPPLHSLVLAVVYKIFGYSFFYGRYFSVALSVACIIVIYLAGRKLYHPRAGLVVAALFAVSPEIMYYGRRVVLESLAILLILIAIYFAADFINNRKERSLLWCGLALGLATATKYLFIPAVVGIILAIILLTMGEDFWQSLKRLGRPVLWIFYICLAIIPYSLLLLFKWGLHMDISVPFLDPMYVSTGNLLVVILVFVLPFFIAVVFLEKGLPIRKWWLALWGLRINKGLWLLVGGTALGFLFITGFFWITMPQEFLSQTALLQGSRPLMQFPSFVALFVSILQSPAFTRMAYLPALLVPILILVILNKRIFSKSDCFLAVAMTVSFLLCQIFFHLPRYYISLMPFFFLGIAWLVPPADVKMLTARMTASVLVVLAFFALSLSLCFVLLRNYTGYDVNLPWRSTNEEQIYKETVAYLEDSGAKKIYATDPIVPALSSKLESSKDFDTYALIFLEEKSPQEIVESLVDEGVDYVLLDAWVRYWVQPYKEQSDELVMQVRHNSRLIKVVEPDSSARIEIYRLGMEKAGIFNGDLQLWVQGRKFRLPLGWDPVITASEGDIASISEAYVAGRRCVKLMIYEDGEKDEKLDYTYAGIAQKILFPTSQIKLQVMPEVNTAPSVRHELSPGIHFIDEGNHSLVVGFSDKVEGEEIYKHELGYRMVVVRGAQLHQWSEQNIDLAAYWDKAGWPPPKQVTMIFVISAHSNNPGYYTFYVSSVEMDDAK